MLFGIYEKLFVEQLRYSVGNYFIIYTGDKIFSLSTNSYSYLELTAILISLHYFV